VPNPKRRHSHSRQGKRRAHDALVPIQLVDCPKCHEKRLAHTACSKCGYYKGRRVLEVAEAK
jgi:large subunit ribosomal protein L32